MSTHAIVLYHEMRIVTDICAKQSTDKIYPLVWLRAGAGRVAEAGATEVMTIFWVVMVTGKGVRVEGFRFVE